MKRTLILVLAILIAVIAVYRSLPPNAQRLATNTVDGVRGAIHVHSRRSDGSGTPQQIAVAAARAGLQFVVLTDHGDGTRTPARPVYYSGVLEVDALEVSGNDGHVVVLGLDKAPYPLGGDVRDIIEDVSRLGGMAIAAHPGSPKPQLKWTEWSAPFDGIEWLNGDSESRDESWLAHTRVLLTYPLAPAASMDQIVTSCSKAIQWVYTNISRYNGNPDLLYLAGHSAGAHLVAMLMTRHWQRNIIKGAAALSGLYNLLPIMLSEINEVLNLNREMADRNSPVHLQPAHPCPLALAVGGDETKEFIAQSEELYDSWKEKGILVTFIEMPGINHYSIVEALADNTSALYAAVIGMMK